MTVKVKSKIWLEEDGQLVFGTGRARLLKAVTETGSLKQAAKKLDMSYRRAWSYVRTVEERFGRLLLLKERGGKSGGGAFLTEYARELIRRFDKLEGEVKGFTDKRYKELFPK